MWIRWSGAARPGTCANSRNNRRNRNCCTRSNPRNRNSIRNRRRSIRGMNRDRHNSNRRRLLHPRHP